MMPYQTSKVEDIKKEYEYKIDPLNLTDTAFIIYSMFYGQFIIKLKDYRFKERINKIKNIMYKKGNKIAKDKLESFENTLKEILDGCKKIKKKVNSDYNEMSPIISSISLDYERYMDKPGVAEVYQKIGKEIIDNEVKAFIEYEKILMSYNDNIINIKKNLNN